LNQYLFHFCVCPSAISPRSYHQPTAPAILLREAVPIGVVVEELVLIWTANEAEEWGNRLAWIPL
jgi:hypothetical protein